MMRRLSCAALAALLVSMLSATPPAVAATAADIAMDATSSFAVPHGTGFQANAWVADTRYESSRYRPRRDRGHGRSAWRGRGVSQVHAGFLDLDGPSEAGFLAGFRGGQRIDDVLEIGFGVDWRTRSGRTTELVQQTTGPGGEVITVRRDVTRYSSNLFPVLAYVQLSGPSRLTLIPYAGAAVSWQVLFLQADDFATGQTFDATFDGFGWQAWAGAALPLSGRSRLIGELFMNRAELERHVYDLGIGQDIRETVSTDGAGARFGMSWGF